uniref:Uncharacterized protein n=1 Tax=Ditylenchus dipsaci TaxID=166011 RepID=A0A915DCF6_9BILA
MLIFKFNEEFALPYMQLYFTDSSKYNWPIPAQLFNSSKRPADQSMDSHAFESVLASPELLEEKKYCIQVRSHRGEIEMQEQDCDTKLTFVCKKPATLLHSVRLTHPIYNQLQSTTEKAVEITIDFSLNKNQTSGFKVVTSSTPNTLDSITTESSTNSTEVGLAEFLSMKTSTARLTTTTTTHNNNDSTTSAADEDTTQTSNHHTSSTVELTSAGPNSTTSSEDSSSSSTDSIETSSLDAENGQGGEEENHHGEGTSLPCFSIATFTWTCVEGEHKNKPSGTTLKALEHNHCSLGTCLGIFLALGLASANPLIEHTREAEHLLDLLRRNNTEVSIHETKMVLYGRIFCAKEEEISVKSRQKRFSSLDELYSAHGYAQSQDMAISRSDGGDVDQGMPAFQPQPLQGVFGDKAVVSTAQTPVKPNPSYLAPPSQPWEVPAYQPQQPTWQQHQQLQWSSGPKPPPKSWSGASSPKLWEAEEPEAIQQPMGWPQPVQQQPYQPPHVQPIGHQSWSPQQQAPNPAVQPWMVSSPQEQSQVHQHQSWMQQAQAPQTSQPQVPWMRTPHPSHSAPNPAPWMNGPVGQQSVPTQQHPQQSQQQQLHMPQQQVPSLPQSAPQQNVPQPHQTMAQHQVGQPMRPQQQTQQQMPQPHQTMTQHQVGQPMVPQQQTQQQMPEVIAPQPQMVQQLPISSSTTDAEKEEFMSSKSKENPWNFDPFIESGAGLTRAEKEKNQKMDEDSTPKFAQPIIKHLRQKRSPKPGPVYLDNPAVKKTFKLEPAEDALVTIYQPKTVGFAKINEPVGRVKTDKDGYFRIEITIKDDYPFSHHLTYFTDCRYVSYQPIIQPIDHTMMGGDTSVGKVVVLGVDDQKRTTTRCPIPSGEVPAYLEKLKSILLNQPVFQHFLRKYLYSIFLCSEMSASLFDNECECPEPIECSTYILWTIASLHFCGLCCAQLSTFLLKKSRLLTTSNSETQTTSSGQLQHQP